ncbi:MAG: general secretion pathway protein GspB [Candidatus Omnitrophica bacterium]|nr:general secretion pathway protein GspB [Candidatus Omnitrophota bacterium]MDD5654362.1 general secretion pathway protein GspB [Candidatus Omnitrophota bacterium]
MRKWPYGAMTIIMLTMFIAGCQEKIPDIYNQPVKKRIIPALEEEEAAMMAQAQSIGLEMKTVQQKTEEEKAREEEAAQLALARTNPFLTKEEEENYKETQGRILIENMTLSAVMYSPPSSKVIIDGAILKEGDNIGQKKIIEIQPKAVILKDDSSKSEYILKTKDAAEK